MRSVWKYIIDGPYVELQVPTVFEVIKVHEQDGKVCIWAQVDTDSPARAVAFRCYGTGHIHLENEETYYVGSAFVGNLVIHVYQVLCVF